MALWGDQNQLDNAGTISLDYSTGVVTGAGSNFGTAGALAAGDLIRIGEKGSNYVGDAIVLSVQSTTQLTIASTEGLVSANVSGYNYSGYQGPVYTTWDQQYQRATFDGSSPAVDNFVYGIPVGIASTSNTLPDGYQNIDAGYVGIITYVDGSGNLRVKRETLVAGSFVQGDGSTPYPTND
jgi:hypothetical protein